MRNCEKCGKLLEENEVCNCEVIVQTEKTTITNAPKNDSWKCILTAIIYPLICCGIGVILNLSQGRTIIGLFLPFLCATIAMITILLGGFWFLLIPLPYIYVWKTGRINKPLSSSKKIIYGILSIVCAIGAILVGLL